MDSLLLLSRVLLALVFVVSGCAKFADLAGSRRALQDFGMPLPLISASAVGLPLLEIVLAVGLLTSTFAWQAAVLGTGILCIFTAGVAAQLIRGHRPTCHCFGQLSDRPIGPSTLLRNGVLIALAGLTTVGGFGHRMQSAVAWLMVLRTDTLVLGSAVLMLAVVTGILAWAVLHLLRQHGRLLAQLDALSMPAASAAEMARTQRADSANLGLAINSAIPSLSLTALDGATASLDELVTGQLPSVLLFVDPACKPCAELIPEALGWQRKFVDRFRLVVISRGDRETNRAKLSGLAHVWLQVDNEAIIAFKVTGTPSAVFVSPDGRIASQVAGGSAQIRTLVETIAAQDWHTLVEQDGGEPCGDPQSAADLDHSDDPFVPIGTLVSALVLRDLDGIDVPLGQHVAKSGAPKLVIFWNPNCGFCRRMLDDLRTWEKSAQPHTPNALLVSSGSAAANRALGLRTPILLDDAFALGRALGATGTPSAILIDASARTASPLAVGDTAVLNLARQLETAEVSS